MTQLKFLGTQPYDAAVQASYIIDEKIIFIYPIYIPSLGSLVLDIHVFDFGFSNILALNITEETSVIKMHLQL